MLCVFYTSIERGGENMQKCGALSVFIEELAKQGDEGALAILKHDLTSEDDVRAVGELLAPYAELLKKAHESGDL